MKKIRRPRIGVEQLEQRDCPALTISLNGSNLLIYGLPTPNSAGPTKGVLITETASNTFNVKNNGVSEGTFVASNVTVNLINHFGTSVNVNLNGNTMSGNLAIGLGAGNNDATAAFTDGTGIYGGTIAGNVTITGGGGTEAVSLGTDTNFSAASAALATPSLRVLGNVTAYGKALPGSNGNLIDTGFTARFSGTTATVFIGGNETTSAYNGVFINSGATVGGNLSANGNGVPFNNASGNDGVLVIGRVGGSVNVNGTPGSTGDRLSLASGALGSGNIGGNLNANFGNGANSITLGGTIGGNAQITSGNGNSLITTGTPGSVGLTVNNLLFNLGNGDNTFADATTGKAGVSANTTVTNNFTINAGNGLNSLGSTTATATTGIAATVFGNLNVMLGNGGTTALPQPVTVIGPVGGVFTYRTGNGTNTLNINGPVAPTSVFYNVNVLFGSGTNTFGFGNGPSTVTLAGSVVANPSSGTNTFNQNPTNGIIGSPWYFSGF